MRRDRTEELASVMATLPPEAQALGAPKALYRPSPGWHKIQMGIGVFVALLGIPILTLGVLVCYIQFTKSPAVFGGEMKRIAVAAGVLLLMACMAGGLVATGCHMIRKTSHNMQHRVVLVCENGIVDRLHSGTLVWVWDDIAAVRETVWEEYYEGTLVNTTYLYTVRRKDGGKADWNAAIAGVRGFGQTVMRETESRGGDTETVVRKSRVRRPNVV